MRWLSVCLSALLILTFAPSARAEAASPASIAIVDQTGTHFSLAALPARYVAVTFVTSRCSDACPLANALFAKLQQRIVRSALPLNLVTLTLDPAFDTPFVMAGLAGTFKANSSIWRLASGTPANVHNLMHAFGVIARPDSMGIPDVHSSAVYILDSHRTLKKILLLSTSLPDDVIASIR